MVNVMKVKQCVHVPPGLLLTLLIVLSNATINRKKQLVAFLCELFLGFGAGHFYSERYSFAILKLFAFLFGIYIICLFPLSAKCISDRCDNDYLVITVSCFYYLCAVGLAFWFIYDLVQFGQNNYYDGNNVQLLPWGSY
jgi:TM2 domain-containing membrane protein YozV